MKEPDGKYPVAAKFLRNIKNIFLTASLILPFFPACGEGFDGLLEDDKNNDIGTLTDERHENWYDLSWSKRVIIKINASKVESNLENFPVFIDLTDMRSGDFFASVKSDGSDIVITSQDGQTKLLRELVYINTQSETGELWFKAPFLSAGDDINFYLYYDNSAALEPNSNDVWANGYTGVWHLNEAVEDENITASAHLDSSGNNNHGQQNNNEKVAGQMGNAQFFDGTDDYIQIPDSDTLDMGANQNFTISAWINSTQEMQASYWPIILLKRDESPAFGYEFALHEGDTSAQWCFSIRESDNYYTGYGNSNVADGTWHHILFMRIGDTLISYEDGIYSASASGVTDDLSNSNDLFIGATGFSGYMYCLNGSLDEIHISKTGRSEGWILTEFNNQSDPGSFYSIVVEQMRSIKFPE